MPDVAQRRLSPVLKLVKALQEEFAAYQLVGEVKAHQGYDGYGV